MTASQPDSAWLLEPIRAIHEEIRNTVVTACEQSRDTEMAHVAEDGEGDTIYAVDRISESLLVDLVEKKIAVREPIVLIGEGISGGKVTLPREADERSVVWRVLVDPIDGTRCLMYQKRSGWILTGVAPNLGESTNLADIELAVQTEIPLVKQHLSDVLWAQRGHGACGERFNRITGERKPLFPKPSTAAGLAHGFSSITRFFAGARDILAAIDDEVCLAALGPVPPGKAYCFEDQYLSTGGQLYGLMMGQDRFLADLRALLAPILHARGLAPGLCCHPYDLCTELIAREAGVLVCDEDSNPLRAPMNLAEDVNWIGYANQHVRELVEPVLLCALRNHRLL